MGISARQRQRSCRGRLSALGAAACLLFVVGGGFAYGQETTTSSDPSLEATATTEQPTTTTVAVVLDTTILPPTTVPPPTTPAPTTPPPTTAPPTSNAPASTTPTAPPPTSTSNPPRATTTTRANPGSTTTQTTVPPKRAVTSTTKRPSVARLPVAPTIAPTVPVTAVGTASTFDLASQLASRQAEILRVTAELDRMDAELGVLVEEYNRLMLELAAAKQAVLQMEQELDLTEDDLSAATAALEARVVGAYKNQPSALAVVLNTTDMTDLFKRVGLLVSIARSDRSRLDEVGSLRARTGRLLDDLSRDLYGLTLATQRLSDQKRLIEDELAGRQAYLAQLGAEVQVLVEQQRQSARSVVPLGVDLASYLATDGQGLVRTALTYLGVPYVWGGATPSGFDCSGLLQYVFMQHGIYLPHYSGFQAQMGIEIPLVFIQPGDLVAFKNPVSHIGMYIGDDMYVHAPRTGDVVKISRLSDRGDLTHIRRILVSPGAANSESESPSQTP